MLAMPPDADVQDHLPRDPWGDLDVYREQIARPLHDAAPPADIDSPAAVATIAPDDVRPLRAVHDGLSECFAGGAPWVPPGPEERGAIERLLDQVRGGRGARARPDA